MSSHTVLIGYGVRGRVVVTALHEGGKSTGFTVVDSDPVRAEQAVLDGLHAVVGPGWRLRTLWLAGVHDADHVVVAVADDAMAVRITSAVRCLNQTATVVTVIHSEELRQLIEYIGADHVVDVGQVTEWAPGAQAQRTGRAFSDQEWTVAEREVAQDEVGSSPLACGHQVLAVLREGERFWAEDPAVVLLREGDRLLVLRRGAPPV
ncbi:NAD(P)-binding protein [Lentzea sp. NPDC051838]|uniref:NAD(P)-binding protein n=1 Tax=Lentzea sp. NPDC051838 TaxID=3154849 RepID=UPI00341AFE5D